MTVKESQVHQAETLFHGMPFDTTKTGIPFYDMMLKNPDYFLKNKGLKGNIVYMSPDEYIALAAKCLGTTTERFARVVDENFIRRYANSMWTGTKFDMPVIECHRGYTEGRHRALAAKKIGVTKVPVFVVEKVKENELTVKENTYQPTNLPTYQHAVREAVPKTVFKRTGKLEINPLLVQAFGITPEEIIETINDSEEPEAMRDMFAFLSDYAALSDPRTRLSITDEKLDFMVADMKRRMAYVEKVYRNQAEDCSKFFPGLAKQLLKISEKARELSDFKGMSRKDKIAFIDEIAHLEHTSGSVIPIAFGISDYGREDYWPRKLLAFLRTHGMPGMVKEGMAMETLTPEREPWQMTQQEYVQKHAPNFKMFLIEHKAEGTAGEKFYIWSDTLGDWIIRWSRTKPTYSLYLNNKLISDARTLEDAVKIRLALIHKSMVQRAFVEGKPVPPEVLAEYSDMVRESTDSEGERHYEKIIKRLHEHKYLGKIMSADYSNLGVRLFDVNKFAMDVGVSSMDLKILLPIKTSDQAGWNLPNEPSVEEFKEAIPRIEYYRQIKKQIFDAGKKGDHKKAQELETILKQYVSSVEKKMGGLPMIREATTPVPEPADKEFKANASLINKSAAQSAYAGTSFEPEKRGEQAIRGFAEEVQAVYERLKPHARTDAEKALLIAEMERFQASYAQKYNDLLYAHSRIYSTMIAGPSGFPAERMRKINEAYDNKSRETYEWKDRVEKAMLRALKGLATEEAGGEVAVLKNKIAQAEKLQEMMVEGNKIVRKKAEPGIGGVSKKQQLINLGFTERQATEALTPDYMGRIGFPSFALTNNSANIRRMKERLIELEKREVTPTAEIPFTGGRIVDNREADRVQIIFDQKPSQEVINKLKSEGWRWSPSNTAWQRKRTDYAMMSARRITGAAPVIQPPVAPPVTAPQHPAVPEHLPLLYPAPPQRPAEEIMIVPNPETLTKEEFVKEKYKRMAQVLRQQGKIAIAERIEKGARDPERTFKYETSHRDQVVLALAQGKTVTPEVLKDYPDIVARIRKENEAIIAKERAERERLLAIERAEENELNAELNKLPPALKRHAETEIYSTLHLSETHKDYRNRFYIALGKVRRIAFTHLPGEKELQPVQPQVLQEPVEPLSPEYERVLKAYLEGRGYELKLQDFIWADKYTIRGTAKYAIRSMEEKRRREEFILKNYNEETGKKFHRGTVISALNRGIKVPDEVLKDYPDLMKKEVPEPTGYFTLRKAQNLIRENNLKLSDEQLHKKSIQLRDYIRFIETPDEYSRKTLVKGGYYAGVIDQFVTGVVPVDPWLHQNLKYTLDEVYKEQQRRKQEKEKISVPTVLIAKPVPGKFVQTTFMVEERMRRCGYA